MTSFLHPFLHLSYPVTPPPLASSPTSSSTTSSPQLFVKGPLDGAYVLSSFLCFVVLREIFMRLVFAPIARKWVVDAGGGGGAPKAKGAKEVVLGEREMRVRRKAATRFAEQGWSFLYYVVYWSFGLTVFLDSTSYRPGHWIPFDFPAIWQTYPQLALTGTQKFYYLSQLGFWFHQMVILNVEDRRKDHWQMFSHHVITLGLVVGSYLCNVTPVGTVVLVLMDFGDILLPLAKMLKYLGFKLITDLTFGAFLVAWLVTRQVGLLLVTLSVYHDSPRYISLANPEQYPQLGSYDVHYSKPAWVAFWSSLGLLWVLISAWFVLICRVAYKVILGAGAEDVRSDDEGEDEEVTEHESWDDEEEESEVVKTTGVKGDEKAALRQRK